MNVNHIAQATNIPYHINLEDYNWFISYLVIYRWQHRVQLQLKLTKWRNQTKGRSIKLKNGCRVNFSKCTFNMEDYQKRIYNTYIR